MTLGMGRLGGLGELFQPKCLCGSVAPGSDGGFVLFLLSTEWQLLSLGTVTPQFRGRQDHAVPQPCRRVPSACCGLGSSSLPFSTGGAGSSLHSYV